MKLTKRNCINYAITVILIILGFELFSINAFADVGRGYSKFNQSGYSVTGNPATDMVNIAQKQIGKSQSDLGYSGRWCAAFIVDCAELAKQSNAIPFISDSTHGVSGLLSYVKKRGGYEVSSPQAGDLVFYTVSNVGLAHVGLMTGSKSSIQGNLGGTVKECNYDNYVYSGQTYS